MIPSSIKVLWWPKVKMPLEVNKITVPNKGIPKASKALTPVGGHTPPKSGLGDKDLWKYPQKKEKKNITSETIKKIIDDRIKFFTKLVW